MAKNFFCVWTVFAFFLFSAEAFGQEKHAVLVAVTNYMHERLQGLKYPEKDAEALSQVLHQSGYSVTLLVGKDATLTNITNNLKRLKGVGDREGVLLLGVFGHGVQYEDNAYYCPYDTTFRIAKDMQGKEVRDVNHNKLLEPDPQSMLAMSDLLDVLRLSPTGNKCLLSDCCRNDPNQRLKQRAFGNNFLLDNIPNNCLAMFACSKGEVAFEHDDWQHGAFTKAILDSIAKFTLNRESVVAGKLAEEVRQQVSTLVKAKASERKQTVFSYIIGQGVDLQIHLPPSQTFVNSVGGRMVLIPPGTFHMGSQIGEGSPNERPQHQITIPNAFFIQDSEVTQRQWRQLMGTEPWLGQLNVKVGPDFPATFVTCKDIDDYCKRLSELEGIKYSLPTESQWEYAARGKSRTDYSFGDEAEKLTDYAWFKANTTIFGRSFAHEVKQKLPNPFGLYDMHGNVWEWCSNGSYNYPQGLEAKGNRMLRGGGWENSGNYCRSAKRQQARTDVAHASFGFRVVIGAPGNIGDQANLLVSKHFE